ncbi:MAG: hypothetical protein ACLFRY_08565 [Spirochaetia bacterium]
MKRKTIIFFGLLVFISLPGWGQEELAPDEADIVLPPMVLELEDLHTEQIIADIPELTARLEPEISVPLPEPPGLNVPVQMITPGIDGEAAADPGEFARSGSFFSKGTIGIGSMNQMFGEITLYKLGLEPHFSLHFLHNRLDGFGFRTPGTEYYRQIDRVDGDFSWVEKRMEVDAAAEFADQAEGLQEFGPYSEVRRRFLNAEASYAYTGFELFDLRASLGMGWFHETLAGTSPLNTDELYINPELGAGVHLGPVLLSLDVGYEYRRNYTVPSPLHGIRADWRVSAEIGGIAEIIGTVGIDWNTAPGTLIGIPFSLEVKVEPTESLSIRGFGGYAVEDLRYYDIGGEERYVQMNGSIPYPRSLRWYGGGGLAWNITSKSTLTGEAKFTRYLSTYEPSAAPVGATGLYSVSAEEYSALDVRAGLRLMPAEILTLDFGWDGSLLGVSRYEPAHEFNFGLLLDSTDGRWGGDVSAVFPLTTVFEVPLLGASGYFSPSTGVEFSLEFLDVLSPLVGGGRIETGRFEAPGFHVIFKTSISL